MILHRLVSGKYFLQSGLSVFEFLDIKVKSVNDIISLVNKMNIATDIDWDINNDKVCISFKNKEIYN